MTETFTVHMFEELVSCLGRVDLHGIGVEWSDMGWGKIGTGCYEGYRGGGFPLLPSFL